MADWFSCKGACEGSDPTSDTVKVDVNLLANEKENVQPLQVANKAREAEDKKRQQEELLRLQREQDQRRQAEEQAKRKRAEEEAARRREEKAAAEREAAAAAAAAAEAKAREEEAVRIEVQRAAEAKAQHEREAAERAAEAQRCEEQRLAAQEKVNAWCKANGFSDMHTKKKSMMPLSAAKIPLHEAVKQKNQEIVGFLIQLGVDKEAKNSKGKTADEIARTMNKGGSMENILSLLK